MDVIVLKVSFCEEDIVKDIEIDSNATVGEASELASSHLLDQESHEDFGLVQPGKNPNCGTWLDPKRTVQESNLHSGDVLQLRRRKRLLKVKTMDGSLVTLMIDESAKVMELIQLACSKIGLKNSDEFSFVTETNLAKHGRLSLLTSKRFKPLRRRLTTTDEVHWLDPAKSLREHGIEERDVLVLRKRFFFSEESTDSGCDPKEVHLMYVQARDAVLNQTHPVTKASAIELAALQCQIEYGNFNQDFVKAGILILANFIPVDYVKSKNIEAKIFQEYEELSGLAELKAKLQYIQLCRSLKTYGVTFFHVKEKMKGRSKLVPRLLGITFDCIMTVDEKTKEVVTTWPLTAVRRWANTGSTFSLDLGGYAGSLYSVQTTEGEAISHLISGYVDMTLKRQQANSYSDSDQESIDSSSLEESEDYSLDGPSVMDSNGPTTSLKQSLKAALTACHIAASDLPKNESHKTDDAALQISVTSSVVAIMSSAASLLSFHHSGHGESVKMGCALKTMCTGMADLTSAMHNAVNKCSDQDESANVVQAALTLIGAVEKLLHLVETADKDNLKDLQVVVKDIGHAGRHLLCTCGELVTFDIAQKSITGISNDIVRRTAYLAKVCMSIVGEGASQDHHPRVAAAVDEMIERSNILNIVVLMLCPVLSNTLPQEVVASVVSKVAKSSESVCGLLQSTCEDDDSMSALADAGAVLIDELQGLISEVSRFTLSSMCHQMECSLSALAQSATLINGSGSSVDMIAEAKKIDKGFEAVVDLMTLQSQREEDASIAKSLLDSAKAITRGALNVIEGAKLLANSGDKQSQTVVKSAAEELLGICHSVNMLLLSKYSETRILTSAETSCDVCSQFIAVIDSVAATADGEWRSELTSQCETTRRRFFVLKCLVSRSKKNPIKLSEFTDASLALANSVGRLVSLSKSAVPRIKDQATALQLGDFAKATGSAISDLRRAAKKSAVAVQISDLDDCSEVLANLAFNGSDGATWLARDNLELSATIQALKSSKASILVALKNSDVGQLVASIKDHVDNMQTWCHAVVKSKNALQQEDGHADIDEELTRAVEYTKEFIAEAKEHVTAGGSTVEATEMLDKGWQAVSTASDILDAAGRLSEADSFPKEEKRGCFRRMTYGIVRVVKKVFSLAWLVLSYVCHLFFMAFLVVCFPFGLCYLCSKCLRRRGQDVPVLHYASSDSSSNVSDSSDDDFDASEFTVSYRGPQLNASQDVVAKLKGE